MSELVAACNTLQGFDTLQILYFPIAPPLPICWCGHHGPSKEQWDQALKEQGEVMRDLAIASLKVPKAECQEGEGRKRTKVRVVTLTSARSHVNCDPGYVNVEEREV